MESMIAERWQELNKGSNLTKAAETVFINFRSDSQAALNTVGSSFHIIQPLFPQKYVYSQLTRHVNELNQRLATKLATLRDLQAEYDKWSWVIASIIYYLLCETYIS